MATTYRLTMNGVAHEVEVSDDGDGYAVQIDGQLLNADMRRIEGSLLSLLLNGRSFEAVAVERPDGYDINIGNQVFEVDVERPGRGHSGAAGPSGSPGDAQIRSPMTGVVVEVLVQAGAAVSSGQVLLVVESMKMNNELRAPRDGTLESIHVGPGDRVERNALLATIR